MTNPNNATQYARAAAAILGCISFFWAAAAHSAPGQPDARGREQARKTVSERTQRLLGRMLTEWDSLIESKLDHWTPTKENVEVPTDAIRNPLTDVSGTWSFGGHLAHSALTLTRSGPNSYDVILRTSGCLGRWTLRRTGSYSEGVLVLNRPVKEYCSRTYQKIYALRVGGAEHLVPDVAVRRIQDGIPSEGACVVDGIVVMLFEAFARTTP